jgi:hypothetical protein
MTAVRRDQIPIHPSSESESAMSSYLTGIAILLLVLSPLFVPVAVTVAPLLAAGVRRVLQAFGLSARPA